MKSNLDWDKFKIFYHIAQAGSFTRAAKILNTVQPSLTRAIQALESQLEMTLFIRTPKGVKLTPQGHILFTSVDKIYQEFLRSELYVQEHQKKEESILKIGLHKSLAYNNIIRTILDFCTHSPHLKLKIIQTENEADILNYKIDVAILPTLKETADEHLTQDYLCSLSQHLYASGSYIKKHGMPQTEQDLQNHHWILFQEDLHPLPLEGHQTKQVENSYFSIESCEGIRQAAEAGYGIAALMIDPQDLKESPLVKILPKVNLQQIPLYLTYPSYLQASQRITQFRAYLKNMLRKKGEDIDHLQGVQPFLHSRESFMGIQKRIA